MLHDYLEGPSGRCQRCGEWPHRCQGMHAFDLSFLQNRPEYAPTPGSTFAGVLTDQAFFPAADYRDAAQREYYAGWESFDAALQRSSAHAVNVQQDAEVTELERLWRL